MKIAQITPGAGGMYCGNCFRDNALVAALRKLGHDVSMLPLYLPLTLDEADQSAGTPIFFSGISVYLEQKSALFRQAPGWFHDLLANRTLLKWAGTRAAGTRAEDLGDLTLSMLRGEEGNQARELGELIAWLKREAPPEVICLSNALLVGLARGLKSELDVPIVCMLQGEDGFLDALPETHRAQCWQTLSERGRDIDLFVAPSRYFGERMAERLAIPGARLRFVHNGINLDGYGIAADALPVAPSPPVLGYFARMCKEKGLDTLVKAYLELCRRDRVKNLRLKIGGGCGPSDQPFVRALREQVQEAGLLGRVEFHPNVERTAKVEFLRSLSVFSVPARYGEAFGLYVIEALAAGVPVVQPRTASFPELLAATGGGQLCAPEDPAALADAIEALLLEPERARTLGEAGRRSVFERFSAMAMARATLEVFEEVSANRARQGGKPLEPERAAPSQPGKSS